VRRGRRLAAASLLLAPTARRPAFAARLPRFFARPLVRRALLVGRPATLAGNLALLIAIHRGKTAIFFRHDYLLATSGFGLARSQPMEKNAVWNSADRRTSRCNGCATKLSRKSLQ
jgi:hypothetical protein